MNRPYRPDLAFALLAALVVLAPLATGCADDTTTSLSADFNATSHLDNYGRNVILKTYTNLSTAAVALRDAANTLASNIGGGGDSANLAAAQQAWRDARVWWENSEAFLFGPVDTNGIDPNIDTWRVEEGTALNEAGTINGIIAATTSGSINLTFIQAQNENVKGFHAIEFILFADKDGSTSEADILQDLDSDTDAASRRAYLVACCEALVTRAQQLADAWDPTDGNFLAQLIGPSFPTSTYTSQKQALLEALDGMLGIVQEVGAQKIAAPYNANGGNGEVTDVESRFSRNSISDFASNIRGVLAAWTGDHDGHTSAGGIDAIIFSFDATLSDRVTDEINAAITAIEAIPATFYDRIAARPTVSSEIEAAIAALATLETSLDVDVRAVLNNHTFGK
ncbi:MAG: imelysin family protein [Planctomycetota bacterium]